MSNRSTWLAIGAGASLGAIGAALGLIAAIDGGGRDAWLVVCLGVVTAALGGANVWRRSRANR